MLVAKTVDARRVRDRPRRRSVGRRISHVATLRRRPVSRAVARRDRQARTMESPSTVMATSGSGLIAGPFFTEPSAMLKLLPWHLHPIRPSPTLLTVQEAWVHVAE